MEREAAAAGDVEIIAERGDRDFGTSPTEKVDGRDGFDLFKTLWQNDQARGHVSTFTKMSIDAPENLRGKRLVIFGAGYVGSALAREALAAGVKVAALTRNVETADALRAQGVDVIVADLAETDWHSRIGGGADFVVNCVSGGGGPARGHPGPDHR